MRRRSLILPLFASLVAGAAAPAPQVVHIVTRDYVYLLPDTIAAGPTIFELSNEGKEAHEALLRRVPDGHTANEVFAAIAAGSAVPDWLTSAGGPGVFAVGEHGREEQILEPGTYIWFCFMGNAARVAHVKLGMLRAMVVRPANHTTAEPHATATVAMKDYSFVVPALRAGKHWIRVENDGKEAHELVIWRLAPGKSLADALSWKKVSGVPAPFRQVGGLGAIAPGAHAFVELDAERGRYVFRCRIEDEEQHKTHFQLGMQSEITIE